LYSQNMGNEWSLEPIINRRANLNDIDFRNNKGFIVGDSTVVLKTINKGNSWTDNSLTSAESLYSLSLSENKVFVLRGYKPINYHYDNLSMVLSANENGNFEATNWPWNHGLVLLNDSLCIISAYMIPTGAPPVSKSLSSQNEANSYNGLQIYSCFLNKGFCIQSSFFYPSFGPSYSQYTGFPFSLCFANDSTGYFISGQLLLKTPSLLGAGIHDNKYNSNVKIIQIENELRVSSIDNKISRVEIINLNGAILNNNDHLNADNMIKINTANLVHGAYIIRVLFSDGSFYNSKWIKL